MQCFLLLSRWIGKSENIYTARPSVQLWHESGKGSEDTDPTTCTTHWGKPEKREPENPEEVKSQIKGKLLEEWAEKNPSIPRHWARETEHPNPYCFLISKAILDVMISQLFSNMKESLSNSNRLRSEAVEQVRHFWVLEKLIYEFPVLQNADGSRRTNGKLRIQTLNR